MIFAADIGGSNTRLAIFAPANLREPRASQTYPSRGFARFDELVGQFLAAHPAKIDAACFGVAGPVRHGRSETVNLPWTVDSAILREQLDTPNVAVINDLEANAYGVALLRDDDVAVINRGAADAAGNVAIISAGTGLGEAGLFWDGQHHRPFASEGGHSDFAPDDELDVELLQWLRRQWEHVSWERVLSGPGLVNIYRFLRDSGRGEEPEWLREALLNADAAAVISDGAIVHKVPLCELALDRFARFYGREAANLALKIMATGGVFIGGGIAPKNLAKLRDGTFLAAFTAKGRMHALLEAIPVSVIANDLTALFGAARCAWLHSQ